MFKFIITNDEESSEKVYSVDEVEQTEELAKETKQTVQSEAAKRARERFYKDNGAKEEKEKEKEIEYTQIDYKNMTLEEQKLALFNRKYLEKYTTKKLTLIVKEAQMLARTLVPMVKTARTLSHAAYLMADRITYFMTPDRQFIKLKDSYLSPNTYTVSLTDEAEVKAFLIQEDRLDVYKDLFGNFKWF